MHIERVADGETDRTSHFLVCDDQGKVLRFFHSRTAAETWLAARRWKPRRRDDRGLG